MLQSAPCPETSRRRYPAVRPNVDARDQDADRPATIAASSCQSPRAANKVCSLSHW